MPSPASASTDPPRRHRRLPALIALAVAGLLLFPTTSGQAAPTKPDDPREKLDELEQRAEDLAEEYRGELHNLEDATRSARRATKRVQRLERDWTATRERIAELAAARYKSGRIDPVIVLATAESPQGLLDRAAIAQHLARNGDARLRELRRLQDEARKARQETRTQVDKADQLVDRLESRKGRVAELIAKYEEQEAALEAERERREAQQAAADSSGGGSASGGSGSGDGSTSTPHPKSPRTNCGGEITARLEQVVNEVDQRFGPFPTIGCYRAGSSGEHPLGRAGDFMLSTGGTMPSAAMIDRGWQVAKWARANASRLGVMYVIYRQQIWDVRSGGGWRPMEDRGSITANHYDHVHISVF